jgi:hypothetical protein
MDEGYGTPHEAQACPLGRRGHAGGSAGVDCGDARPRPAAGWLSTHARRDVAQKLAARARAGAEFSSLYVTDILARERKQAGSWLTGRRPTRLSLARSSQALGFSAALVVDRGGRVLQTAPAQPDVMGVTITGLDPYLAPALAGRATVSNVVQPATGLPVVATAVPFATSSGRRALSGTFDVSKSPLGGYMRHVIVIPAIARTWWTQPGT